MVVFARGWVKNCNRCRAEHLVHLLVAAAAVEDLGLLVAVVVDLGRDNLEVPVQPVDTVDRAIVRCLLVEVHTIQVVYYWLAHSYLVVELHNRHNS